MKGKLNFSNKLNYTLISIGVLIFTGLFVYAFGGNQPTVVGHSGGELDLMTNGLNGLNVTGVSYFGEGAKMNVYNNPYTGPDLEFDSTAIISADRDLHIIIDDNSNTDNKFSVRANGYNLTSSTEIFTIFENGNVDISGDLTVYGTCYNGGPGTTCSSDIAEEFDGEEYFEPGDVVVLSEEGYKRLKLSTKSYDTTVVGVISTNPTITMGKDNRENPVPLALSGVVPVKVTNENGKIVKGDLLTTSSKPGRAMKCKVSFPEEKIKCMGAIIGKSMEECSHSECVVNSIVMLG